MAWLILVALFWKPILIIATMLVHLVKRDTVNFSETFTRLKSWGLQLWSLVSPNM